MIKSPIFSPSGAVQFCVGNDGRGILYYWNGTDWVPNGVLGTELKPEPTPPFQPSPPVPAGPTRANFCNLYDSTGRPIFSSCLAAQTVEMQKEWIDREVQAGGNSYFISVESGYKNTDLPPEWGYGEVINFYLANRLPELFDSLGRILDSNLTPVLFLHSGGKWPGISYFAFLLDKLTSFLLNPKVKFIPAWEPVPGDWETVQLRDTINYLRTRISRERLILHLGRRRLSWSSNPLESSDPFKVWNEEKQQYETDEIASCRWAAPFIGEFFYQSDPFRPGDSFNTSIPESNAERAKEVAVRVLGTEPQHDWYSGLPRPILTASETVAYWFIRRNGSPEYAREVASFFKGLGYQGFGNGVPD